MTQTDESTHVRVSVGSADAVDVWKMPARGPLFLAHLVAVPASIMFLLAPLFGPPEGRPVIPLAVFPVCGAAVLGVLLWAQHRLDRYTAAEATTVGPLSVATTIGAQHDPLVAGMLLQAWVVAASALPSGLVLGAAAYPWVLAAVYEVSRPLLLPVSSLVTVALALLVGTRIKRQLHWIVSAVLWSIVAGVSATVVGAKVPGNDTTGLLLFALSLIGGIPAFIVLAAPAAAIRAWWPAVAASRSVTDRLSLTAQALVWLPLQPGVAVTFALGRAIRHGLGQPTESVTLVSGKEWAAIQTQVKAAAARAATGQR